MLVALQVSNCSNKNIKMCSFKSSDNIQKKEDGQDRSVSDNQSPSVTLNELAMKARKKTHFNFVISNAHFRLAALIKGILNLMFSRVREFT